MLVSFFAAVLLASCGNDDDSGTPTDTGTETDTSGDWDPEFDAFVAALMADLNSSNAYGVSAAVMRDGEVVFAEAFGSKDPGGSEPLTPATLMQIGSTTKQMTAAVLLQRVENGEVSLTDNLEETLPLLEFDLDPTWDDQVSLHHLLSHQGGFYDWIPWDGPADDSELEDYTYDYFDDTFFLMSPPGAFWNYSNPNFVLAGLVTETLDSRAWPDIMVQDLFTPLGMDRTFLRKIEVAADGDYAVSFGFGVDDLQTGILGPVEMPDMPDPGWARPAGLAWTTPTQMMTWATFIMDGDASVLSNALREEITAPQVDTLYNAGTLLYGYGMFVSTGYIDEAGNWYEMPVWDHGGNTTSFTNIFYILPEQDFALAICSSAYNTDFYHSLDVGITTLADLPAPSDGPVLEVDPDEFDRHVGEYNDPWNVGEMIVTREGDALLVDFPLLTDYGYAFNPELVPITSEIFIVYIGGTALEMTFIPLAPGGVSEYARTRSFVETRVTHSSSDTRQPKPSRAGVEKWLKRALREQTPHRVIGSRR